VGEAGKRLGRLDPRPPEQDDFIYLPESRLQEMTIEELQTLLKSIVVDVDVEIFDRAALIECILAQNIE